MKDKYNKKYDYRNSKSFYYGLVQTHKAVIMGFIHHGILKQLEEEYKNRYKDKSDKEIKKLIYIDGNDGALTPEAKTYYLDLYNYYGDIIYNGGVYIM